MSTAEESALLSTLAPRGEALLYVCGPDPSPGKARSWGWEIVPWPAPGERLREYPVGD